MKHLPFLAVLLPLLLPAHAQQNGIDQAFEITRLPTGESFLRWHGHPDRSYFLQTSDPVDHLRKWFWSPVIEQGHDEEISYEIDSTADKAFFRLHYTDQLPAQSETLDTADFDNDGLTNLEEISPPPLRAARGVGGGTPPAPQTNPLNSDTDGDGMLDGSERNGGFDPTNSDENGDGSPDGQDDTDGDGLSNGSEQENGTNPRSTDTDNDGVADPDDAAPSELLIKWPAVPESGYVMIEIDTPNGGGWGNDLNDNGDVLCSEGVWSAGEWQSFPIPEPREDEFPMIEGTVNCQLAFADSYWLNFNNAGERICEVGASPLGLPVDVGFATYGKQSLGENALVFGLKDMGNGCLLDNESRRPHDTASLRPLGIRTDGITYAVLSHNLDINPDVHGETWVPADRVAVFDPSGTLIAQLDPGQNRKLGGNYEPSQVSPSGWVGVRHYQVTAGWAEYYGHRLSIWNPQHQKINLPSEATGNLTPPHLTDMPGGGIAFTTSPWNYAASKTFVNYEGGIDYVPSLSNKGIRFFSGDGTAITHDGKLWRNGRLTPIADLSRQYKDYVADGWQLNPLKANKFGTYLINATHPNGQLKSMLMEKVDLISDLNNDGQITAADNPLRDAAMASGATDEIKDKGTEFIFHNDTLSNGIWDKEDTDPARPTTEKYDDDAEEITIKPGITKGEVWLDHPAIAGLSFYKTRECNAADKVNLSPTSKFTVSASNPFPDKLFMRADGTLTYPEANPQFEGELILKIKVGTNGQEIEAVKMKLTVVKDFGAEKYFYAARDYTFENNTVLFINQKKYYEETMFNDAGVSTITTMRQESTIMRALDAYRTPTKLYGIDSVTAAYPGSTVIINGNMTFDEQDISGGRIMTRRCHGRLISSGALNAATSSDNDNENLPPPNIFGIPDPLRGSELAGINGKYIAMISNGVFKFAKGRVPLTPIPSEALGGLSTNYSVQNPDQLMGIASVGTKFKMLFTVTNNVTTSGITTQISIDAKKSGVESLSGGTANELNLFKFDGGSSLALSYSNPSGILKTPIKGSKHTGRFLNDYCVHTYILLKSNPPR